MIVLWVITAACLLASLVADRARTFAALRMAGGRLAVSIPLVIIASHFMGRILERRGYAITQ